MATYIPWLSFSSVVSSNAMVLSFAFGFTFWFVFASRLMMMAAACELGGENAEENLCRTVLVKSGKALQCCLAARSICAICEEDVWG